MVGFNRRFSPHIQRVKQTIGNNSIPINIIANMNAGAVPKSHWVHDLNFGGGRIIGEACHLMDVCVFSYRFYDFISLYDWTWKLS